MSTELTQQTMQAYGTELIKRGPYGEYFTGDVTFTLMGPGQEFRGAAAVEGFIRMLHEQAFDAQPQLLSMICGDGQAALEAIFRGKHTAEFMGVAATGRSVEVPYSVFYELRGNKISALRAYMPVDVLMGQLTAPALAAV
jgi:predicted ester cyclase